MENIVRLAEYRKRRGKPRAVAPVPCSGDGAQYFCTRCDGRADPPIAVRKAY